MPAPKDQFDLSEKISVFREKYLKDGKLEKITREMSADILTMQRECVEAGRFEPKRLLCTCDYHPEESFPAPINASHIVIDAYTKKVGEDIVLMNDWSAFNTSKGKIFKGLLGAAPHLARPLEDFVIERYIV